MNILNFEKTLIRVRMWEGWKKESTLAIKGESASKYASRMARKMGLRHM